MVQVGFQMQGESICLTVFHTNGVAAQYEYGGNLIVGDIIAMQTNVPLTQSISKWNGSTGHPCQRRCPGYD